MEHRAALRRFAGPCAVSRRSLRSRAFLLGRPSTAMRSLYLLIDWVLWFYSLILIIYVVMGLLINFGVVNAYNRFVSAVYEFLMRVTEPVLRPIRRILPNMGPVDLSPLVVFILIWFARNLLAEYWPVLMGTSSRPATE
jgi:YggT family protein